MIPAADRWAEQLAGWGVPEHILARAPESPWAHETSRFAVDAAGEHAAVDTPSLAWSREVLPPVGGTVLDVGCGGGRGSIPLAPEATEITGVDTSPEMLDTFARSARARGIAHRTVLGSWPDVAPASPVADVVVCHHVVYDVADIVPFVLALTDRARLAVVVELTVRHPLSGWTEAWEHFWGVIRPDGPTDLDLVDIVAALGLRPEHERWSRRVVDDGPSLATARRRLCLTPDRDDELADWLAEHPPAAVDTIATLRWPGDAA